MLADATALATSPGPFELSKSGSTIGERRSAMAQCAPLAYWPVLDFCVRLKRPTYLPGVC
jgi:hypothetical protein